MHLCLLPNTKPFNYQTVQFTPKHVFQSPVIIFWREIKLNEFPNLFIFMLYFLVQKWQCHIMVSGYYSKLQKQLEGMRLLSLFIELLLVILS